MFPENREGTVFQEDILDRPNTEVCVICPLMRRRPFLIFLGLLTLLTGLLVASYAEGVSREFCTDWCSVQDENRLSAFNSYYDNLAVSGILVALAGLTMLITQSIRTKILRIVPAALSGLATSLSGLLPISERVYGLQNNVIAIHERFGLPFAYKIIWCAQGLPSYCVSGAFTSFSLFNLLLDLLLCMAVVWPFVWRISALRSGDLLVSRSGQFGLTDADPQGTTRSRFLVK